MKKLIIILIILIILLGAGYYIYKNFIEIGGMDEYVPEEEISEEQYRQTIVSLYYKNKDTGKLMRDARRCDATLLIENPYKVLVRTFNGRT